MCLDGHGKPWLREESEGLVLSMAAKISWQEQGEKVHLRGGTKDPGVPLEAERQKGTFRQNGALEDHTSRRGSLY